MTTTEFFVLWVIVGIFSGIINLLFHYYVGRGPITVKAIFINTFVSAWLGFLAALIVLLDLVRWFLKSSKSGYKFSQKIKSIWNYKVLK